MAFYSSKDPVICDRVLDWPLLASLDRDFEWLTHDTDKHLKEIVRLFSWYLEGMLPDWVDKIRRDSSTKQERDEIVWKSMAEPRGERAHWDLPRCGSRPRDFAELGSAVEAGRDWGLAFGDWLHEFVFLKAPECLQAEPPAQLLREDRALLAGVAEFFARRFSLSRPDWVDKPEYFLSELEYVHYCETRGVDVNDPEYMYCGPLNEQGLYRKIARTPKELLLRNVVFEARSLTVL
jgi:hypothetical protein